MSPDTGEQNTDESFDLEAKNHDENHDHQSILQNHYGSGLAHDIGEYMENKRRKIQAQFRNIPIDVVSAVLKQQNTPIQFLSGVVAWINGYTSPPFAELRALICAHGGEIEMTFMPQVTHVIATSLPPSKVTEYKKSR